MAKAQSQIPPKRESPEMSQAFFAAMLEAQKSDCDCKTCRILRSMADDMTSEFLEGE